MCSISTRISTKFFQIRYQNLSFFYFYFQFLFFPKVDDYVFGALIIYMDIIQIFLQLLELLGKRD